MGKRHSSITGHTLVLGFHRQQREEKEQGKSRAPMPAPTPAVRHHLMPEPDSPTGVCLNSPLQNCRVTGALILGTVPACTL